MIVDNVLFALIILGLALCSAYFTAEYRLWRKGVRLIRSARWVASR